VLSLDGEARANGRRLEAGAEVEAGSVVEVARGRAVVGAPECNGFHALLLPGSTRVGGYDPNGRGEAFTATQLVVMRADEHVGPFFADRMGLQVEAEARRCADCALSGGYRSAPASAT
jgi:hypothetical protein